jgi:hypothetical protein
MSSKRSKKMSLIGNHGSSKKNSYQSEPAPAIAMSVEEAPTATVVKHSAPIKEIAADPTKRKKMRSQKSEVEKSLKPDSDKIGKIIFTVTRP